MSRPDPDVRRAAALQQQGRRDEAERLLRKAIVARPADADAHYRLAMLRAECGALAEAHYFAAAALAADPGFAPAHGLLGRLHLEGGAPGRALESYDRALALAPRDPELLFGRGVTLRRLGRDQEALESYAAALQIYPDQPDLLCNQGNLLHDMGRHAEALASFDRALQANPAAPLLHYNRGNTLLALGRFDDAVGSFDAVIRLDPQHAEAWNNRGNALLEMGRVADALESFARALAMDPQYPEALTNRGNALLEMDQPQAAVAAFAASLALDPGDAATHNGLGMAHQRSGQAAAAHRHFARALELEPGFLEARYNDALLCLFERDFARAWEGYEARLGFAAYRKHLRKDPRSVDVFERMPRWAGPGAQQDGVVAIWAEQGIGDQILFSTLLPELLATGQRIVFEVDARLLAAYRRAFPEAAFVALADPPAPVLTGAQAALFSGSLPGFFRREEAGFARQPRGMLAALPSRVAHYAAALGPGLKVALSWRSMRAGWVGRNKSAELADFAPLFAVPGVRWVDVQYGDTKAEREALASEHATTLVHFDAVDYREDLEEVLAIIAACDLLITTSNANAHFAGALGKPVWLLYPAERPPFHYWTHAGNHRCLWHPSVEIVSAPELVQWSQLAAHAATRLRSLCN